MKGGSHRPTARGWSNLSEDNGESVDIGGNVLVMLAGGTLLVGDCVLVNASGGQVAKTAVAADYQRVVGIVVGGENTNMEVLQDDALIGALVAATINQRVIVCISGICKAIADGTVSVGSKLTGGTATAGRVKAGVITTDLVAGQSGSFVGTSLTATTVGLVVRVLVGIH